MSANEAMNDSNQDAEQVSPAFEFRFGMRRRAFVQRLSAGVLIAAVVPALAQRAGGRGGGSRGARTLGSRILLGKNGSITLLTGKVEGGQGARTELTQAAAEELRVEPGAITTVMADTDLVPDDGITAGSRSTPSTVPAVRQGAAAARELLIDFAARKWNTDRKNVGVRNGEAVDTTSDRKLLYNDLAAAEDFTDWLKQPLTNNAALTPVRDWKVLGTSFPRPNGRAIVTGEHKFPSDISRPGMLYGTVLRPPAYGAKLVSVDLGPAKAMEGVVAVHDDQFVGVAAQTSFAAREALQAIEPGAKWEKIQHPSSNKVFGYLRQQADAIPENPFKEEAAAKSLKQAYHVSYVQHAPLEPRAAVAEWDGDRLTVWTGTQNPFGCRSELARTFRISEENVRVVVPDFGAGFGGKHTGEVGVEAARMAKAAARPVLLRWTRREEFTNAYFRPAAVIEIEASIDPGGRLTSWHYVNINSGTAAIETPYQAGKARSRYVGSKSPLRQGSYRALAATANNFARESFMDELAAAFGRDPLEFRLAHIENPRLRAVLETATDRFKWKDRARKGDTAIGLACGTEKGSYVAGCVEIELDKQDRRIKVLKVCEVFECGKILNPSNLLSQVQGQIMMGMGPALWEEMRFEGGEMLNASFGKYRVPRLSDIPELDIHLLDRPDLEPAGGGETPIMVIAPAIANALFRATGIRVRTMPIRLPE